MEICKEKINFLGHEIGEGKIYLQEHIAKKILEFPDNMSDKKVLQQFLGIVNYARNYIDNLAKLAGPLCAKLRKSGQKLYLGFKEFTVRTDREAICRYYNKINKMRKGLFANKDEYLFFGEENRLKMFQPSTFNFKPKPHIKLDEAQRCILDNFWFQYTLKREEKGYFYQFSIVWQNTLMN
uniref:Reverse transcriptase RNase H-like domain-containing protein n=1 Tax=Aegilops tauschii subsp. strangulata TaxID=200361 RepID=A0A453E316_AEGTS